jgi:hypothetical protein
MCFTLNIHSPPPKKSPFPSLLMWSVCAAKKTIHCLSWMLRIQMAIIMKWGWKDGHKDDLLVPFSHVSVCKYDRWHVNPWMNGWKWQSQGFLLKKGTKVVIKETKDLTLFIWKVDSRKCIFCGQNRMRKVKN